MKRIDISIVIPAWNRADFVERLLGSIADDQNCYQYGQTEVLVIDSSVGVEQEKIRIFCDRYGAIYCEGDDNVRKKRNLGIRKARYPYVLFLDSDVEVRPDLLNRHAETIMAADEEVLGGTFGVTEFVGKKEFLWKVIEYTTFVDSFGFARKFPYQSWTIGNNVLFVKSILEEIGMFEENLPFRLGGDDLDLSYRITKKGYLIKSVPEAVTWHARDTWNSLNAVFNRARRWGSMEFYLEERHPEIFITVPPKTELFLLLWMVMQGILSLMTRNPLTLLSALFFAMWCVVGIYTLDVRGSDKKNFIFYVLAKVPEAAYYFFHINESVRNGSLRGIYRTMSFSTGQTRHMLDRETKRCRIIILGLVASLFLDSLLL